MVNVMSRYTDADKLIRKYIDTDIEKFSNSDVKIVLENLKQNILKAPSIDIVRCKECKWAKANGTYQWCGRLDSTARITADDFCSYGERREP